VSYYCEVCQKEVVACSHWYNWEDLEPLLRDVDVVGKLGIYWYIVGTVVVLSYFVVGTIWNMWLKFSKR
jgi:hypothetical protein